MVLFFLVATAAKGIGTSQCIRGEIMAPRLLVLDDKLDLLFLYQLILEPEGYDVPLAASGFEQMMAVEHFHPDLLILDYHLNRRYRDTEPLLRQLKAYQPTAALPVILCTADVGEHYFSCYQGQSSGHLKEKQSKDGTK